MRKVLSTRSTPRSIDGAVNGAAKTTLGISATSRAWPTRVSWTARSTPCGRSSPASPLLSVQLQTGVLQNYALMMLVGIGALISFFYFYLWT